MNESIQFYNYYYWFSKQLIVSTIEFWIEQLGVKCSYILLLHVHTMINTKTNFTSHSAAGQNKNANKYIHRWSLCDNYM